MASHNEQYYTGAYGRDGPPSDRVMRGLDPAFQYPSPRGLHVDTTRDHQHIGRPLYSPQPQWNGGGDGSLSPAGSPPPSYSGSDQSHHHYTATPPKAAFVAPPCRSPASIKNGQMYAALGEQPYEESVQEKTAKEFRSDEEPQAFWKRMSARRQEADNSPWLNKHAGKAGRFKAVSWTFAILVLLAIGGSIAYYITHRHAGTTEPATLSWANYHSSASGSSPTATLHTMSVPEATQRVRKRHFGAAAQHGHS